MLFLGTYPYSMDERGRVPIPPRFRDAFLTGVILTQGTPDKCVRVYPLAGFEETAASYLSSPEATRLGRVKARTFFSSAYQAELDRQGRLLVPPQLRRWAGLDGDVVIAGAGRWFEVWPQGVFDTIKEREEAELEALDSQ
jgi:transcriptional regulator MraZ